MRHALQPRTTTWLGLLLATISPAFATTSSVGGSPTGETSGDVLEATSGDVLEATSGDVLELDLEDLLRIHVTSPSRREQPWADVPAAVTVLRADDLARLGVTSLPEALRAVSGMLVARSDANTWAVTSRGFSDTLANKLLVMIDGRTVYSPLHSGVFWDVQDVLLEDVDRIEIIRGPGGSLWGANAINGIINVITKSAADTVGGLLTVGAGSEERGFARFRHGFDVGERGHARFHARYVDRDEAVDGVDDDRDFGDDLSTSSVGFRADWKAGSRDGFTLMGDFYAGREGDRITEPTLVSPFVQVYDSRSEMKGGDLVFRWDRSLGASSDLSLQLTQDYTSRSHALFKDTLNTTDVDFQHRFAPRQGQDLVWGVGYRLYRSDFDGTFPFLLNPSFHADDVVSAFVQDEFAFSGSRLRLTIGSKFELNDYSGFEAQPGVRLAWRPGDRHMAWFSVSKAVRTPSIIDVDVRLTPAVLPSDPPTVLAIMGNRDFASEELVAYEAGWRVRPIPPLSIDLSVFFNRYDDLRSGLVGTPFVELDPPPVHVVVPIDLRNDLHGETKGAELALSAQAAPRWLVQANWSLLRMDVSEDDVNRRDPRWQAWLRSSVDLPRNFSLDVVARHVGAIPFFEIDPVTQADLRLAWHDRSGAFEVALVGKDLLDDLHAEYETQAKRARIQRSAFVSVTWRY